MNESLSYFISIVIFGMSGHSKWQIFETTHVWNDKKNQRGQIFGMTNIKNDKYSKRQIFGMTNIKNDTYSKIILGIPKIWNDTYLCGNNTCIQNDKTYLEWTIKSKVAYA